MKAMRLLVTAGDPAGIGSEVVLRTIFGIAHPKTPSEEKLRGHFDRDGVSVSVLGSRGAFTECGSKAWEGLRWDGDALRGEGGPRWAFVDVPGAKAPLGIVSREAGAQALAVLEKSIELLKRGEADGVCTGPVCKESIDLVKPGFIGHTEFYGEAFGAPEISMAFTSPFFNLVLMTTHLGVAKVSGQLTPRVIDRAIGHALLLQDLQGDGKPLAVMGFNPHAGEGGLFGGEDGVIADSVKRFQAGGRRIDGPLAADSAFVSVAKGKYATVVACYHDQGLIPLKMLAKGSSVNVTLGLPIVRTSVDHGTGFDIAGKGVAEHGSMVEAMLAAVRLFQARG